MYLLHAAVIFMMVVVCVIVQSCQSAVIHPHGQTSSPSHPYVVHHHIHPDTVLPHDDDPRIYPDRMESRLLRHLKSEIASKNVKYKEPDDENTQQGLSRKDIMSDELPTEPLTESSATSGSERPAASLYLHHPQEATLKDMEIKTDQYVNPNKSHTSQEELKKPILCKNPRNISPNIATAPPNVCDLCPDEDGKNPLDPCTCVGVGGTGVGQITIHCPSSIVSLDQLRDIFHNTNFLVNHVFQFTLEGSNANGALTRDIWGEIDFKYVNINSNKITDVDNGAFITSAQTLLSLNLANNNIRNYVAMYNDLPNLQSLNLRGNNISIIYSEDFTYPSLTELDLSSNQIISIGTRSFAALKKLQSLNLSNNELPTIEDERFTFIDHDFSHSLVINLSNNHISSISDDAFLGLRYVEVDLRSNQLHTVDKNVFYPVIIDSGYRAYFHFTDNPMVCNCNILWVIQNANIRYSFDNFLCTNIDKYLYNLKPSDLGNCTTTGQPNGLNHS